MLPAHILLGTSILVLACQTANGQLYRGGLRFSDGPYSGHLEVEYHSGVWGNLCGLAWDWAASAVACRQLSLGPPLSQLFLTKASSSLPVVDWQFMCYGSESHLADCIHFSSDLLCDRSESVTLQCAPPGAYRNYEVVTVEDENTSEEFGLLPLIRYRNSWHTICHTDWGPTDVSVLCLQMGFNSVEYSYTSDIDSVFQRLYPCHHEGVYCSQGSVRLTQCLWYPQEIPSPASYLHVKCMDSAPTEAPLTTNSSNTDSGGSPYGLYLFVVLATGIIGCFFLCKVCRSQTSPQTSGPQIQIVSIHGIEEETVLPANNVQELANDLPPTYEQYVTNPRLFRSMSEQSNVLLDLSQDRAESPPPEYHHVASVLTGADAPAMGIDDASFLEIPVLARSSSDTVPVSPPPDYSHGNPFPRRHELDEDATSGGPPSVSQPSGAGGSLDTIPESRGPEPVTIIPETDDLDGNLGISGGGRVSNETSGPGGGGNRNACSASPARENDPPSLSDEETTVGAAGFAGEVPDKVFVDSADSVSISSCTSSGASSCRSRGSSGDVSISPDGSDHQDTDDDSEAGPEILV